MLIWDRLSRRHCHRIKGMLSEYLDHRLGAERQHEVEEHLKGCSSCRRALETLRSTVDLLHLVPQAAVPRSFALREMDVKPALARPRWATPVVWQAATAAAVILLAILVVGDVFNYIGPSPATQVPVKPQPEAAIVATATPTPIPTPAPTPTPAPKKLSFGAIEDELTPSPPSAAESHQTPESGDWTSPGVAALAQPTPSPEPSADTAIVPPPTEVPSTAVSEGKTWSLLPFELALAGLAVVFAGVMFFVRWRFRKATR